MTKLELSLQKKLHEIILHYPRVMPVVEKIHTSGGRALLVGGAVRDLIIGLQVKDLDIEVYGLEMEGLEQLLRSFGPVSLVGKSFGVFRLHGVDVDWSMPRTDSEGRKPHVVVDPTMSFEDAFGRRDLTINAMGIDLITYQLIDPYHGQDDLRNKILRAPKAQLFVEDPLRFFRVMQFIGRFEIYPDEELNNICVTMSLKNISVERIEEEFEKLFLKSARPSLGLRWIQSLGRLHEILPERAATIGIEQDPRWHPEGDVFEHLMQSLDAAAALNFDDNHQKLIVLISALCHDLGKVSTSVKTPEGITCYGHDEEGAKICTKFVPRVTRKVDVIEAVIKLVAAHMQPLQFVDGGAKPPAYKRLARRLAPQATMNMLALLAIADARGCNPDGHEPLTNAAPEVEAFLQRAQHASVQHKPEEPVLYGRDIIDMVAPGPKMGELLKKAYEIQIEQGITDKEILKSRLKT